MALSVDDLLTSAPRLRKKQVNYGPGLDFELHSFTAQAYEKEVAKLKDMDDDGDDDAIVRLAMKLIEGEHFEPTADQVFMVKEKLDEGVIRAIISDGLQFNRGAESLAAAAKKS